MSPSISLVKAGRFDCTAFRSARLVNFQSAKADFVLFVAVISIAGAQDSADPLTGASNVPCAWK